MRTYKNVSIINYNEAIENADIFINDNGIIEKIEKKSGESNMFAFPSPIDIHYHSDIQNNHPPKEFLTNSYKYFVSVAKDLYKSGNYGGLWTTPSWQLDDLLYVTKEFIKFTKSHKYKKDEGKIMGLNFEGPFIHPSRAGGQYKENCIKPTEKNMNKIEEIFKLGEGLIKISTFAPEWENSKKFIELCKKYGVVSSIGHTTATLNNTKEAINQGSTLATHLWQGMTGVDRHDPGGVTSACLLDDRIYLEFIASSNRYDIIEITKRVAGADRIILITDYANPVGRGDGEYYTNGKNFIVKDGIIRERDTGKTVSTTSPNQKVLKTMVRNIRVLSKHDFSMQELVKMSSYNQAKLLSLNPIEIKVGQKANITFMDKNFFKKDIVLNFD